MNFNYIYLFIGYLSRRIKLVKKFIFKCGFDKIIRKRALETVIRLKTGEKFLINTQNWIGLRCFLTGAYDIEGPYEFALLRIASNEKIDFFFDIGANHGYYSIKVSSILPNVQIYSFEPFSSNVQKLIKNKELNNSNNIHIINKVVSDKEGAIKVYFAGVDNDGSTSCIPQFKDNSNYEVVEAITIDTFVEENNLIGKKMFKIDVEGFEPNVLKGMKNTLRQHDSIVFIEHNSETLSKNNSSIHSLIEIMKSFNYKAYDIKNFRIEPYCGGDRGLVLYIPEEMDSEKLLD
ncbi:FkbM family methyltransferase [Caldithrix abyssi]|nr:FkbM family methyltransferase [Caldithrix abyssi]